MFAQKLQIAVGGFSRRRRVQRHVSFSNVAYAEFTEFSTHTVFVTLFIFLALYFSLFIFFFTLTSCNSCNRVKQLS